MPSDRIAALHDSVKTPDLIQRFGFTRDEILQEIGRQGVQSIREEGQNLGELITVPLGEASKFSGLTRDELRRIAPVIDHGKRNQRLRISDFQNLLNSRTQTPKK